MMRDNEIIKRMDAIEKRQRDLERLVKGLAKKKASPKKAVKKKAGEVTSSDIVEKRKE